MSDLLCADDQPVDLAAVQADEVLVNQLAGLVVVTDSELARVLYAWRRDVESEPFPVLSTDVTSRVVVESRSLRRRVVSWFRRLLGGRR